MTPESLQYAQHKCLEQIKKLGETSAKQGELVVYLDTYQKQTMLVNEMRLLILAERKLLCELLRVPLGVSATMTDLRAEYEASKGYL